MNNQRARDWFNQAQQDYLWAQDSLTSGHFYGVCFLAQQIAEKCLKAVAFFRDYDQIKSHSVLSICIALKINGKLEEYGRLLDQYYISTRYPDGLPSGNASMFYTRDQAVDALGKCKSFIDFCADEIKFNEN